MQHVSFAGTLGQALQVSPGQVPLQVSLVRAPPAISCNIGSSRSRSVTLLIASFLSFFMLVSLWGKEFGWLLEDFQLTWRFAGILRPRISRVKRIVVRNLELLVH